MVESTNAPSAAVAAAFLIGVLGVVVAAARSRASSFRPAHPPSESAVLITGGSRGIGRATADHLLRRGYHVFVTVRKQSQFEELERDDNAPRPVLADVTKDDEVEGAVKRVEALLKEKNAKLVAVVNNAGINPEGDEMVKFYEDEKDPPNALSHPSVASRVLETNVVGAARVTRAFLPLLPEGGRIVNVGSYFGSIAGKAGLCHAYYEASKFALEGLSDNFRRSLKSRGVAVSLVKPGNIATDMNAKFGEGGPEDVARDVEHAVGAPRPRPRYYPGTVKGTPSRVVCWVFEMLPAWVTDGL